MVTFHVQISIVHGRKGGEEWEQGSDPLVVNRNNRGLWDELTVIVPKKLFGEDHRLFSFLGNV